MGHLTLRDEGLEILDEGECLHLLGSVPIGRVAVTMGALPAVFPVNFVLNDRRILFRTGRGSKLTAAVHNAVVAFQVDAFDATYHDGWSVMAIGRSAVLDDAEAFAHVMPWVSGDRSHCISIDIDIVSGRRISHIAEALDLT